MGSKFKKVRKVAKKIGRAGAKVTAKIVKPVTGVLSAVATVAFGPAAGLAIAGAGAAIARQQGATAARAKGKKGKEARTAGRKLAKKTLKIGLLATGAGTVVSAGVSLATGGNVLKGALGGQVLGGGKSAAAAPEDGGLSTAVTEDAIANPGAAAAEGGILSSAKSIFDILKPAIPGQTTPGTVPDDKGGPINQGVPGEDGEGGELGGEEAEAGPLGIPKKYLIGAAIVLILLFLASRSRGSRKAA